MDSWVVEQNIARFRERLKSTGDGDERRQVEQLLAEERAKLKEIHRSESANRKS